MVSNHGNAKAKRGARGVGVWAIAAGVIAASGCSRLDVESLPSPGADFSQLRTFRIVDAPIAADTRTIELAGSQKPILNNGITDQVIRDQIRRALEARGYIWTEHDADFEVAFHARARERIELTNRGRYYCYNCRDYYEYTEGTIVVDAVDPETKQLLWRGTGIAEVSDDPQKYLRQVDRAVEKIVSRFPTQASVPYLARRWD